MSACVASLARRVDVTAPSLWPGSLSTLLLLLLLFHPHCHHCPPPLSVIITPHECPQSWRKGGYDANRRRATTSSSSDADNISQGQRAQHRHHRSSSSSRSPLPDFRCCLPPLLIVKCPSLRSILVSVNFDAVKKDVGNGIILEIVIGVALPI